MVLTGYDQTQARPSLARVRKTGVRDLLSLLLGPVCVADGAAPSMLTHRDSGDGYTEQGCQAWLMTPTP